MFAGLSVPHFPPVKNIIMAATEGSVGVKGRYMSQVAGLCGSWVSFIVMVAVGCCVKGYRVQQGRALEFESWGLVDSGAELGMIFHKMVKSPNAAGMTVKHIAGGGVEVGYSFSRKDCPKEREKAIGCTWKGFRFPFKRLAVGLKRWLGP